MDYLSNYFFQKLEKRDFNVFVEEKRVDRPIPHTLIMSDNCFLALPKNAAALVDSKFLIQFLLS